MFRKGLALLLITCTLAANFSRLFVFAGFQLNQKYIAATLCENKDKPWLHCNGRCYLMKKVHQAEEKEKSAERQTQKNLFQDAFYSLNTRVFFNTHLLQIILSPYTMPVTSNVPVKLLRPPRVA